MALGIRDPETGAQALPNALALSQTYHVIDLMQLKDTIGENQGFLNRAIVAGMLVFAAMACFLRMAPPGHRTRTLHDTVRENRVKVLPLPPTRGLIYDRNGVLLAQNRPAYSLEITSEQVDDLEDTLAELSKIIEIGEEDLERFWQLKKRKRRLDSVPVRVNLSPDETAQFAVHRHRFPGRRRQGPLLRHYPHEDKTTHVLGYVGRISQRDVEQIDGSNYAGTSSYRQERRRKDLRIRPARRRRPGAGRGQRRGTTRQDPRTRAPDPGIDAHLHIDIGLQEVAIEALGDNSGAVVAIDPNNGGVLALVSKPGYDPNLFVEGISSKNYKALQEDEDRPLYNRALRGQYPPDQPSSHSSAWPDSNLVPSASIPASTAPGSSACRATRTATVTGNAAVTARWPSRMRSYSPAMSIFYKLAYETGVDRLHEYLSQFGFGNQTGIDLTGESGGLFRRATGRNVPGVSPGIRVRH